MSRNNGTWVDPSAISLGDYLIELFKELGADAALSQRFLDLQRIYGKDKLRDIYRKAVLKRRELEAKLLSAPKELQTIVKETQEELGARIMEIEIKG